MIIPLKGFIFLRLERDFYEGGKIIGGADT